MPHRSEGKSGEEETVWVIRPMEPDDAEDVDRLEREAGLSSWGVDFYRKTAQQPEPFLNLVLVSGGKPMGYCACRRVHDEIHLNKIAVDPAYWGQGFGTVLLRGLLKRCLAEGIVHILLEVRPSNTRALNLYRRHRFEEVGRRERFYPDNGEDCLLLSWRSPSV